MRIGSCLACATFAIVVFFVPSRAEALINAGAEAGVVRRSADSPSNLDVGFGIGVHGELSLIPLINVGPYYLHYELSSADRPALGAADAVFNALGLRARSILPVPGSFKPYGYVGVGYVWASYSPALGNRTGHLIEIPIGVGVAFEKILELFQITADVAYRPAFGFGGDAFNGIGAANHPTSGWSVLLGAAIAL